MRGGWLPTFVGIAILGLALFPLGQAVPQGQTPPAAEATLREFYQDFRKSQALHPSLALEGPDDVGELCRFGPEGLRITLPAGRPINNPAEVVSSFSISGDFEITGTYELLSATRPAKGYGVGITLNIADTRKRNKFAKIVRNVLPRKGSVFQGQYWVNGPRHDSQERTKPTASRIGQLRLVRQGAALRFLAADGLEGDFQEILSLKTFCTDDMGHVLLGVTDSGSPGFAVDARLLDFKIRAAKFIPDPAALDFRANSDSVSAPATELQHKSGSMKWLAALAILGLGVLLALVVCLIVYRRRRSGDSPSLVPVSEEEAPTKSAPPSLSLQCSGCEKVLKVKTELAGKKIKCPQCGQMMAVPAHSS